MHRLLAIAGVLSIACLPGFSHAKPMDEASFQAQDFTLKGNLFADPSPAPAKGEPAYLQAENFVYDNQTEIFTATGNVVLEQEKQLVTADKMIYDRRNDVVYAEGHVAFTDKTGQTYFAEKVKLEQGFKKAAIEQIGMKLSDGSRLAGREGEKIDENQMVLREAVYSPCDLCKEDPRKAPMWQLRADKIVHDQPTQDIYYHNVKIDAYGVPVAYLPYFSHPDPNVKARSGLLMPVFSTDSKKGFMLRNYYYYNVSPSEDATIELSPTQNSGTVLGTEYRRRFQKGDLLFNGSVNYSEIRGGNNDNDLIEPKQFRGHIFTSGSRALENNWVAGYNFRHTFDRYYLRDFDFSEEDILVNNIYLDQIKGRNHANINGTFFQDLRPGITLEQPDILPWAKYDLLGEPNKFLGGRWSSDNEFVTLFRNGNQSMSRISAVPGWERRDILPFGLQSTLTTQLRADGYWVRQDSPYVATKSDPNLDTVVGRVFPTGQAALSYPLVRPAKTVTMLVEPKVALTVAPNTANNDDIPNEDSRDAQIDISNLFDLSRFPGYDRVENGSHIAYSVRAGGYHENGNSAFASLGQSYRLNENNPCPQGSGLEENRSDIVGQIEATFYNRFYTDYRFQLNEQDFNDLRHELQAAYMSERFEARTNYVLAQVVEGTGLPRDRQQLGVSAARALTKKWSVAADALNDLSGDSGLLKGGASLQYKNECLRLTLRTERDLTDRLQGGSDSRVLFSLGLRNLGGYNTPLLENDSLYQPFGTTGKL